MCTLEIHVEVNLMAAGDGALDVFVSCASIFYFWAMYLTFKIVFYCGTNKTNTNKIFQGVGINLIILETDMF